mgnify:CR=1 FL=1
MRLLTSECFRAFSTRTVPLFLAAAIAVGFLLMSGLILLGPEHMNPPMPPVDTEVGVRGLLGLLSLTAAIPVAMGSQLITSELADGTYAITLLTEPRRWRVIGAKLAVALVIGSLYGMLLAAGTIAGICLGSTLAHLTPGLPVIEIVWLSLRLGASMALYTVLGVGIGALLQRPQICLVVIIGWFYFGESLLSGVPGIQILYPWTPGGAASAISGQSFVADAISRTTGGITVELLSPVLGALVLLMYALAASVVALATSARRDVRV